MIRSILLIGGTGIVGSSLVELLHKHQIKTTIIAKDENPNFPSQVKQIIVDINSENYENIAQSLGHFDAVYNIIGTCREDAKQTYDLFKEKTNHFISLSTSLVYNRDRNEQLPITEDTKLAQKGKFGGYVDSKVEMEEFWYSTNSNWTILRPYHILGKGSLLGNLPIINRDPNLVQKIQNGETLRLFRKGDVSFQHINPRDLAEIVLRVANNPNCYKKAYNCVNPKIYIAKDYMQIIGKQLGKNVNVEDVNLDEIYGEGWEMTLLNHIYSIKKLEEDIGYVPFIPLEQSIYEALKSYPPKITDTNILRVHNSIRKGNTPQIKELLK